MANPKVRPHLSFYPEDSGLTLSQARQASRWLHEIPNEQTTPMARFSGQDYYIYEPAMLRNGNYCIPVRWFMRNKVLFAKCWELTAVVGEIQNGWRVIQTPGYEVSQQDFLKNFTDLQQDAVDIYGVPHPSKILGWHSFSPYLCIAYRSQTL